MGQDLEDAVSQIRRGDFSGIEIYYLAGDFDVEELRERLYNFPRATDVEFVDGYPGENHDIVFHGVLDAIRSHFPLLKTHIAELLIVLPAAGAYVGKKVIDLLEEVLKAHLLAKKNSGRIVYIYDSQGNVVREVKADDRK